MTRRIFLALLMLYGLIVLGAYHGPAAVQDATGIAVMLPLLSASLLHRLGISGMLTSNGACGWGWCSLTPLGWCVVVALWTGIAWFAATGLAKLAARTRR